MTTFLVKAVLRADVPDRPGEFAHLVRPCTARPATLVPASFEVLAGGDLVFPVISRLAARSGEVAP